MNLVGQNTNLERRSEAPFSNDHCQTTAPCARRVNEPRSSILYPFWIQFVCISDIDTACAWLTVRLGQEYVTWTTGAQHCFRYISAGLYHYSTVILSLSEDVVRAACDSETLFS